LVKTLPTQCFRFAEFSVHISKHDATITPRVVQGDKAGND